MIGWYFKIDGKMIRAAGKDATASDAEKAKQKYLEQGGFLSSEYIDHQPVRVIVDKYMLANDGKVANKTMANIRTIMKLFVPRWGDTAYSDLRGGHVKDWLDSLGGRTDAWRYFAAKKIRAVFNYFVERERLKENRLKTLRYPKPAGRSVKFVLPDDVIQNILTGCPAWLRDILCIVYATGARPGEIVGLLAEEYDSASGRIVKISHKTENKGMDRVIVVPLAVRPILDAAKKTYPTGRLFRGRKGGVLTVSFVGKRLKDVARSVGVSEDMLPFVCMYGLRHKFAMDMWLATDSATATAAHLGHKGTKLLEDVYGHLRSAHLGDTSSLDLLEEFRRRRSENGKM